MAALTLAGSPVLAATITMPGVGCWVADVEIAATEAPAGRVELAPEVGAAWSGTVIEGGVHGQTWRGNVDAHGDGARAQALQRQGVVDLGGVRVVDGKSLHIGQRQFVGDGRGLQIRETCSLGEPFEQESLPVKVPGRVDGTGVLQQGQRGFLAGLAGFNDRLVFGRVLVRLEQDLVELLAHRLGALTLAEVLCPGFDLGLDLLFLFDGGQRLLHDLGSGLAKAPLAGTAEVVRRFKQAQQRGGLLHRCRAG